MLLNKERALQKMAEFKLDALIAAYPENVSYLSPSCPAGRISLHPSSSEPSMPRGPRGFPPGSRRFIHSATLITISIRTASPWRERSNI